MRRRMNNEHVFSIKNDERTLIMTCLQGILVPRGGTLKSSLGVDVLRAEPETVPPTETDTHTAPTTDT